MSRFHPSPLYAIVDAAPGERLAPLALAEELLSAGVRWLQLRAKSLDAREHLDLAREMVDRATVYQAGIIVNDRLDVAAASGAAGVHLGQEDLPLRVARPLADAADLLIGISTHSASEARAAQAAGADYVGFGPMFATESKSDALPARQPEELRAVRNAIDLPIVAIGGITEEKAARVLAGGADAVAMIGALAQSREPAALARRLLGLRPQRS